jgi:hypothetical protein
MNQEKLGRTRGQRVVTLRAEAWDLEQVVWQLERDLADAPLQVRELALGFIERAPELVCLEQGAATGAGVTVLLKPSQRLLDLVAAVRAGDLEFLAIKGFH